MKVTYTISLILSLIFMTDFSYNGNQDENQTETLLNSKQFVFQGRKALPSGGRAVDLTTNPSYIKFEPELIESHMPFFGRAYAGVGYGDDPGLHFTGEPEKFTIDKKGKNYLVQAIVRTQTDSFDIYITVSPDGSASLSINSNNRESMSFFGDIEGPEKAK